MSNEQERRRQRLYRAGATEQDVEAYQRSLDLTPPGSSAAAARPLGVKARQSRRRTRTTMGVLVRPVAVLTAVVILVLAQPAGSPLTPRRTTASQVALEPLLSERNDAQLRSVFAGGLSRREQEMLAQTLGAAAAGRGLANAAVRSGVVTGVGDVPLGQFGRLAAGHALQVIVATPGGALRWQLRAAESQTTRVLAEGRGETDRTVSTASVGVAQPPRALVLRLELRNGAAAFYYLVVSA